jgi:hypothetical protein
VCRTERCQFGLPRRPVRAPLAARLPEIVTAAEATCADSDDTAELLAQDYNRSAGDAAARAGDRDRADDLPGEAAATADRLAGDSARQKALAANVSSHRFRPRMSWAMRVPRCITPPRARLDSFPDTE